MSKLGNIATLLEWLYADGSQLQKVGENEICRSYFNDDYKPLFLQMPVSVFTDETNDPLKNIRLSITDGEHMDMIHNIYNPHAIFAGHVFGTFAKTLDERGIEHGVFRLVDSSKDATCLYREIIWQCPENTPKYRSLHKRMSYIAQYRYSIEMKLSGGMVGGVNVDVMPITRGLEGIVKDYFNRTCL